MTRYTRSQFLRLTGAAAAGLSLTNIRETNANVNADTAAPDLALINGKVLTIDDELPYAEAFAIKHGRFVAVGSNEDIRNIITSETKTIDAEGLLVTPGFIDAHSHPASGGVREIVAVNLDLRSIDSIKQAIRNRASRTPVGEWVLGF